MTNEQRAEAAIRRYGFVFEAIPKEEIQALIRQELQNFQPGSSEYIRLLCGYLYCLGGVSDIPLLEQVKYGISMDVGCMVDGEWIDSLKNGGMDDGTTRSREALVDSFVAYYRDFTADDEEPW